MGNPQLVTQTLVMSEQEARQLVNEIKAGIANVGRKLLELKERDGWRTLGYSTWRECAQLEFGYRQSRVYQLLEAAEIERNISTIVEKPIPESHLRPLTALAPEQQREAWALVRQTAPDGKVTASHVERVVDKFIHMPFTDASGNDMVLDLSPREAVNVAKNVHFSSDTPEWYTPQLIIDRTLKALGKIDLDPCSNSKTSPNVKAKKHYTIEDDGLSQKWSGRIYMNPPYGREIEDWVIKLCESHESGDVTEAIALVPARVDTQWWSRLRDYPVCFISGRLKFGDAENSAPFPSAVVYLGNEIDKFYYAFCDLGDIWQRIEPGMFGE